MALGVRQVLLLLRANDQATRMVNQVGAAVSTLGLNGTRAQNAFANLDAQAQRTFGPQLYQRLNLSAGQVAMVGGAATGVGLALVAAGAAGASWLSGAIQSSFEYDKAARLTMTQARNVGISLNEIKDIGRRVAGEIAIPFEQMQGALYDIFSSIDVNAPQAEQLLLQMGKAAVAGNVDIQDSTKFTIGLMNAFRIPIEEVTHVLDVQFAMVRRGFGTYEQFASTVGRSVSSAVRAGQSFETLTGVIAFLTRNNVSAAMATTATARAMDAFANSNAREKIEALGVAVVDRTGEFRDFADVFSDIGDKIRNLPKPEQAAILQDVFKGAGGTIQARRAIDLMINRTDEMRKTIEELGPAAKGSFAEAYGIMAKAPVNVMERLNNQWKIFKEAIGETVGPLILRVLELLTALLQKFNGLSPSMKKFIGYGILIGSALAIIVGAIIAVIGILLIFTSLIMTVTGAALPALIAAAGPVGAVFAGIVAAMAMMVAGAILLYKVFTGQLKGAFGWVGAIIGGFLTKLGLIPVAILAIIRNFDKIKRFFTETIPHAVGALGGVLSRFFTQTIPGLFQGLTNFFTNTLPSAVGAGLGAVGRFFTETIPRWVGMIVSFFMGLPGRIGGIIGDMIVAIATWLGAAPASIAESLGFIIGYIIGFFITLPGRIYDIFVQVGTVFLNWGAQAGAWAARTGAAIINAIIRFFQLLPGRIAGFFATIWNGLVNWGGRAIGWAGRTASSIVSSIIRFFQQLPGRVASIFSTVFNTIVRYLSQLPGQAARFASGVYNTIRDWIGRIPGIVGGIFNNVVSVLRGMVGRAVQAAIDFGRGIWNGIKSGLGIGSPSHIERAFWSIEDNVLSTLDRLRRQGPRIADNAARGINGAFGSFPSLANDLSGTLDVARGNRTAIIDRESTETVRTLQELKEMLADLLTRNPELVIEMDKYKVGKILKRQDQHDTRAKK